MQLTNEIVEEHIRRAEKCLTSAQAIFSAGDLESSVNRLYYCVFNCASALLATEGVSYKKHSAVIGHFNRNYINTGILDGSLSKIIEKLFIERNGCDYDMGYFADEELVKERINDAAYFLEEIKKFLNIR